MKSSAPPSLLLLSIVLLSLSARLNAQDTRTIREPVLPPACITLKAAFTPASATRGEIEPGAGNRGPGAGPGASPAPARMDTARLQQALDHCGPGKAVELAADGSNAANAAFLTGPLSLRPGVTLLVDRGVTLYGSRNPEYYALTPGSCGLVNDAPAGCRPLISAINASGSGIMGDGAIDGQGGAAIVVDGRPAASSWWDLAEQARTVGRQQAPRLIESDLSDDLTLFRITLKNSPSAHVSFRRGDGLTIWGARIDTPKTARATDGIDISQSRNVTITQSYIRTGDDHIAIQAGDGPTTHVTVMHSHLYWGHGLTIGSETTAGASGIRVLDLSLDGPDNGLRIRSSPGHGGLVEDVIYDDVCIRNAKNPILFDTAFSFPGKAVELLPVYDDITLRNVRISGGGRIQFNGFDQAHRIGVRLDGVLVVDAAERTRAQAIHTDLTFGPGPVNLVFTGDDSTVTGRQVVTRQAKGSLPACTSLQPFP